MGLALRRAGAGTLAAIAVLACPQAAGAGTMIGVFPGENNVANPLPGAQVRRHRRNARVP